MNRKRWIVWVLALILIFSFTACQSSSAVASLKLHPDSVSMVPGVSMQLIVKGYTKQGASAGQEKIDALELRWDCTAENDCFTVDEQGWITAISPGVGTVWVQSEDGTLASPAIEVFVTE